MRRHIFCTVFLVCSIGLNAQNYNITNGTVNTCTGTFYDSGGNGGTYSSNEYYTYTICPSIAGAKVTMNFTDFDCEDNYDILYIYDGTSAAAPTLGAYDNGEPLVGTVMATGSNASGCITFVFDSDGTIQYDGWRATISCTQPCQQVVAALAGSTPAVSGGYISICQGQTVSFNGSATFPQNGMSYTQSIATSTFTWDFGDGTSATGQNVTHTYANEGGYEVTLTVTDVNGCVNSNNIELKVRVSTTPTFTGTNVSPTAVCVGQSATLTGSPHMTPWSQPTGGIIAGTTFLPDGSGIEYTTQLCFTDFASGQTLTSASDVVSLCMDLEHSFLGDLEFYIECPNGDSMMIFNGYSGSGGGEFLGEPIDDDGNLNPGIPYTYCFTPGATTSIEELVDAGAPTYTFTDLAGTTYTAHSYIPGGTYAPESGAGFAALVGCPLNGCWTIHVIDHIGIDNGYIFQWSIDFNPALYPSLWGFTPTLATQQWSGTANSGLTTTASNSYTVTPTVAGNYTYTYTITDNYGCSYDTTVTLSVSAGPAVTASASPASVCPGQGSTLTASGASTYTWSTGASGASITVNPGSTTTYTVTGTSAAGCVGTATVTVTVSSTAAITASASPTAVCSSFSTTVSASGGSTYVWGPSGSGASFSAAPTATTTYSVTGTTVTGCTGSATVLVTVNPIPTVTASASPASVCSGQSSTLSASGASTYAWSSGSTTVNPTATTTYTVTGTSASGCTGIATVTVTVNSSASITASAAPAAICNGQSTTLTAAGGSTYVWNGGSTVNPLTVSPTTTTTYSVTGTTALGCSGTATVTVTVNPLPTVTSAASPSSICLGSASTLTAGGASSYLWSTGQNINPITVSPSANTTYTVTGTSSAGCTGIATVTVSISASLSVIATATPAAVCLNQSSTITASGASIYTWSPAGTGSSFSANPTATTTYSVTGTDAWGCTGSTTVALTVNPIPSVTVTATPATICAGQGSTITASGANSYTWSPSGTGASFTASPATSTTYNVTGSTAAGCTGAATVTLTVNPIPNITATASPTTVCVGFSTTVSGSGGTSYVWDNGQNIASFSEMPAATTTYNVTGTDANNCSSTATVTVTLMPGLTLNVTPNVDNICEGENTTLTASSPGSGVGYSWDTGAGTASIIVSPVATTTYSVTGTDASGCSGSTTALVNVDPIPVAGFTAGPLSGCDPTPVNFTDQSTGNITIWDWEFGDGDISGLQNPGHVYGAGTFSVTLTVTTAAGCQSVATMNNYISVLSNPNAAFTATPAVTTEDAPTITFINQSSGASIFAWSFGDDAGTDFTENPVYTYNGNGSYLVTLWVENAAGCADSSTMLVNIKPTYTFYLSNAFSPNGDGRNDVLRPFGTGWDPDTYSMRIYSRWGDLVFSTTDINHGWNGLLPNGAEALQDIYSVLIRLKGLDGKDNEYYQGVGLIR